MERKPRLSMGEVPMTPMDRLIETFEANYDYGFMVNGRSIYIGGEDMIVKPIRRMGAAITGMRALGQTEEVLKGYSERMNRLIY